MLLRRRYNGVDAVAEARERNRRPEQVVLNTSKIMTLPTPRQTPLTAPAPLALPTIPTIVEPSLVPLPPSPLPPGLPIQRSARSYAASTVSSSSISTSSEADRSKAALFLPPQIFQHANPTTVPPRQAGSTAPEGKDTDPPRPVQQQVSGSDWAPPENTGTPVSEDPWEGPYRLVEEYDIEKCTAWKSEVGTWIVVVSQACMIESSDQNIYIQLNRLSPGWIVVHYCGTLHNGILPMATRRPVISSSRSSLPAVNGCGSR